MKTYIVDASFVLRAMLSREGGVVQKFTEVFDEQKKMLGRICATGLLKFEVANSFNYNLRTANEAEVFYRSFSLLPIEIFPLTDENFIEIIKIASDSGTTVYDTSYHFLAQTLGGTFLTCDQEYFRRAKKLGGIELVS